MIWRFAKALTTNFALQQLYISFVLEKNAITECAIYMLLSATTIKEIAVTHYFASCFVAFVHRRLQKETSNAWSKLTTGCTSFSHARVVCSDVARSRNVDSFVFDAWNGYECDSGPAVVMYLLH